MYFARLSLLAFGPFQGLELDFEAPGLHVVFGRNEAGKSTTLRALTALLYGIEPRTQDAHTHKPADLRVGGVLVSADGTRLSAVRRKGVSKGGANTLLDAQGKALDESVMRRLLHGVPEETFRHAFGLDHDTLAEGAKALLEGQGDVAGSLFDASVGGGVDARRLLAELEAEVDAIYKPRGSTQPFNVALKAFSDGQKKVREKERLPTAFVQQEAALEKGRKQHADLTLRRSELVRRRAVVDAARRRLPLLRRRKEAEATLVGLESMLVHHARISSLGARVATYELAAAAHAEAVELAHGLRHRVADAARRAGVQSLANANDVQLDGPFMARVQKLLQERRTLTERIDASLAARGARRAEIERLRSLHVDEDGTSSVTYATLKRALSEAQALGDAAQHLALATSRRERRLAEIEARALSLGIVEGGATGVLAVRPPPTATLDAMQARAVEVERRSALSQLRLEGLDVQLEALERQSAELLGELSPPSAEDLRIARLARDEHWKNVYCACLSGKAAAEVASLGSAFERASFETDAMADRMIREADRVTLMARHKTQRETLVRQRAELTASCAALTAERVALEEEHASAWREAGFVVSSEASAARLRSLSSMREWLTGYTQIKEAMAAVDEASDDVRDTTLAIERVHAALCAALEVGEGSPPAGTKTLPDLIDLATSRVTAMERLHQEARSVRDALTALLAKDAERVAVSARDELAFEDAQRRLAALLEPLSLSVSMDADDIARSLEALRDWRALSDQLSDVERKAERAHATAVSFEDEVNSSAAAFASDLCGLPTGDVVTALGARAKRATDAEAVRIDATRQLDELGDTPGASTTDEAIVADPEGASQMLEALDQQILEVETELHDVTRSNVGLELGLTQMQVESGAADAAAEAEEALTRTRAELERYARAKVAALILSREMDRYREEHQGPMLTKASAFFERLTLSAYSGLRTGYDDKDRPALRCVRRSGTEVDVAGLSDGARDQLYLSLRLATLACYVESAEPLPVVLDDVFIQFDDERAAAGLRVLFELSKHMQILFFTHHARMVDLARHAVSAASLHVHELGEIANRPKDIEDIRALRAIEAEEVSINASRAPRD
jgi:uncharacterized protein YhaN